MKRVILKFRWVVLVGFVAIILILLVWPRKHSFVVNSRSSGFALVAKGQLAQEWPISEAVLCTRKETGALASKGTYCDGRRFNEKSLPQTLVGLPSGTELQVTYDATQDLLFLFARNAEGASLRIDGEAIDGSATLIVPKPTASIAGALPLSGWLTIGELPVGGEARLLSEGKFQIRGSPVFQANAVTLKEGTFFPGDKISVVGKSDKERVEAIGHFVIDDRRIELQFLTEPAHSQMKIERLGAAPSYISASWIDQLRNDPVLVLVSIILALITTGLDLYQRASETFSTKRKPPQKD